VTDLARRDFTVNAIAWGRGVAEEGPPSIVDPFEGRADLERRILRAVGDPAARFGEDALRMIRAVRLAAVLGFTLEPATLAAIHENAALVAHLSHERVGAEVDKLLLAPRPSVGLRLAAETGLLEVVAPELAAQRGVPQNKVDGEDLWDHTLRTVDAAPASRPVVRLAALVHDLGKPATLADGHFHHHDVVGARLAESMLRRLRFPRPVVDAVVHLVRHHMFTVDPSLSDAGIRRFLKRVEPRSLDALFALRRADDIGSGLPPDDPVLVAFRTRLDAELAAEAALDRGALAIDGDDLIRELGLAQGPRLGQLLDALLERVLDDPQLNDRATLLLVARGLLREDEAEVGG
jgi:putative nucleotidyltransferase with HDIG domain